MTKLQLLHDADQNPAYLRNPSDTVHAYALTANTPKVVTIPADARFAIFAQPDQRPFYVRDGEVGGLTIPTADVTNGSAPEPNPVGYGVTPAAKITMIAAEAMLVYITFYTR